MWQHQELWGPSKRVEPVDDCMEAQSRLLSAVKAREVHSREVWQEMVQQVYPGVPAPSSSTYRWDMHMGDGRLEHRPAGTRTIYKTSIPTGTSTPTPGTCATEGAAPGGGSVHRSTATDRRRHGQTESVYSTSTCVGLVRQHLLTTVYYVLTTVYIGCSSVSGSTISSSRKIDLCHSQSKRLELQTGLKLALAVYATHGQLHTQRRIEGDWIIGESA